MSQLDSVKTKSGSDRSAPEAISRAFAAAISRRDPNAAVACFSAGGRLLTPDGTEVAGAAAIGEVLGQLLLTHPLVLAQAGRVVTTGSTALASQRWTTGSPRADSGLFEEAHTSILLLGKGAVSWQVHVAAPWGL